MKLAKDLLDDYLELHRELAEKVDMNTNLSNTWKQVLADLKLTILSQNTSIISFEEGVLGIKVKHPVFLQDLKLRQSIWKPILLRELQTLYGENTNIHRIFFRM